MANGLPLKKKTITVTSNHTQKDAFMYLIITEDDSIHMLESITQDDIDASMSGYITIVNMNTKTVLNYDGEWDAIEEWPALEEEEEDLYHL